MCSSFFILICTYLYKSQPFPPSLIIRESSAALFEVSSTSQQYCEMGTEV